MEDLLRLADFEAAAAERLAPETYGYVAGGAADEITLRDNEAAWQRLALRPRMLVNVQHRNLATTLLGRRRAHPVLVAPTGFQGLVTPEAEVATARAAEATDTIMCLSTSANTTASGLAAAVPGVARWFQLYVHKDPGVTRALVLDAAASGYEALVVTVDLPILGRRERDLRSGFLVPMPELPAMPGHGPEAPISLLEYGLRHSPTLTWAHLAGLAELGGLPLLVKGILRADDAVRAAEHGAAGVVVSNHGGRQLDTVLATADALGPIVDAAGDRLDVLVDGGIRRGTDVVKALALGARAVMVGRPVVWGLAVGGAAGARRVLELLLAELDLAFALCGVRSLAELDRSFVQPGAWAPPPP